MTESDMKPCTVCGSVKNNKILFKKDNAHPIVGSINICYCVQCHAIYLGMYDDFFDEELYNYYDKYLDKTKDQIYDPLTKKSYFQVLKLLESNGCKKSILDVGCGNGSFVDAALDKSFNARGIELSQAAVDVAKRFNLPVQKIDFFSEKIEYSSLDAVTMFEVIEHVPCPNQFLQRAAKVVRPGGLIYLTTPNYNSLDRRILKKNWNVFHREHLTYFTPETLIKLIQSNTDLEIIHSETRNLSIDLINYIRCLGSPVLLKSKPDHFNERNNDLNEFNPRAKILQSPLLSKLKRGTNSLLNATSLGSTIVLLCRRPSVSGPVPL